MTYSFFIINVYDDICISKKNVCTFFLFVILSPTQFISELKLFKKSLLVVHNCLWPLNSLWKGVHPHYLPPLKYGTGTKLTDKKRAFADRRPSNNSVRGDGGGQKSYAPRQFINFCASTRFNNVFVSQCYITSSLYTAVAFHLSPWSW